MIRKNKIDKTIKIVDNRNSTFKLTRNKHSNKIFDIEEKALCKI